MYWEIFKMAGEALWNNRVRTLLSILGIIIGVFTVIAVFAIGRGSQQVVSEQFQNLSANSLIIMSNFERGRASSSKLQASDATYALENVTGLASAVPIIQGNGTVAFGQTSSSVSLMGVTTDYLASASIKLDRGSLLTADDVTNKAKLAVLGSTVAEDLFVNNEDPVGQTITIAGKVFTVVGTLQSTGSNMGPMSLDSTVFVPYEVAAKNLLGSNARVMINATVKDINQVETVTEELTAALRQAHKLRDSQEDDFRIMDAGSMVGAAQESAALMTVLLTAIAAITLLVSGIGIMNVMFVIVSERTKEIGIAKAIGGRRSDILNQFLLESIILSMIGGLVGVILGQAAIPIISYFNLITVAASWTGPVLGFSFSVVVGVFFGFYPALKASRLDPVDALRSE